MLSTRFFSPHKYLHSHIFLLAIFRLLSFLPSFIQFVLMELRHGRVHLFASSATPRAWSDYGEWSTIVFNPHIDNQDTSSPPLFDFIHYGDESVCFVSTFLGDYRDLHKYLDDKQLRARCAEAAGYWLGVGYRVNIDDNGRFTVSHVSSSSPPSYHDYANHKHLANFPPRFYKCDGSSNHNHAAAYPIPQVSFVVLTPHALIKVEEESEEIRERLMRNRWMRVCSKEQLVQSKLMSQEEISQLINNVQ